MTTTDPAAVSPRSLTSNETRLVVDTVLRTVPGVELLVLEAIDTAPAGFDLDAIVTPGAGPVREILRPLVHAQLRPGAELTPLTVTHDGITWHALTAPIAVTDDVVAALLVLARPVHEFSPVEREQLTTFSRLLSHVATQSATEAGLLHQRSLDELVTKVANQLMATTVATRSDALDWVTKLLAESFDANVTFLRRNDHAARASILLSEWPLRTDIPDPDPLQVISFDADPVLASLADLKSPKLYGEPDRTDEYSDIVRDAGEQMPAAGICVPLLRDGETWGTLGFIHFARRAWSVTELNALTAVAAMLIQLEARLDAEARTLYHSLHDELTGLPNRRALLGELNRRLSEHISTAVMLIDLDRFKVMNDFLGHAAGDRLLVTLADRVRTSLRTADMAGRLGGDEFVCLVDHAGDDLEAMSAAYRLLEVLSHPVDVGDQTISHTASIGVALAPSDCTATALDLLSWADLSMYAAKTKGRNQVALYADDLRDTVNNRSEMELLLREGIEAGDLRLHYQPEVDLRTGELLALESLVRWQHPTLGLLPAGQFITLAEETGLVANIGRWVFAEACRQLSAWRRDYPNFTAMVRVNMSPVDFKASDLVEFVERTLSETGAPGSQLCIEITEHAYLDDPENVNLALRRFRALGLEVALDDFGTGFASMTGLKNLPVDMLKLDMSFVRGITSDNYDRAIVESIILLAAALDLGVIAEGVEDHTILNALVDLGCHRGQGYLISRPVPAETLDRVISSGSSPVPAA